MSAILIGKDETFVNAPTGMRRTCSGVGLASMDLDMGQYKCIFHALQGCTWKGSYDQLLQHCQKSHDIKFWPAGEKKMQMNIKDLDHDEWRVEIIQAFNSLFCMHIKVDTADGMLYVLSQEIGSTDTPSQAKFMIRTEFCSADNLQCLSNSTLIYPYTHDISKIKEKSLCMVKPLELLKRFTDEEAVLKFTAEIFPSRFFP